MAEYLSKEEIKEWRSSLEKITLEEFAARRGKLVAENRPTNDLVDIVFSNNQTAAQKQNVNDKLSRIAERAFERERQLSHTPFSFKAPVETTSDKLERSIKEEISKKSQEILKEEKTSPAIIEDIQEEEDIDIVLKKNLTDREQVVFDYLIEHRNQTVYAKDLAILLNLPRDYIYKYIKNLRAKIEGDKLKNADKGGFILEV